MKTRMHEILGVEEGEVFEHLQRGLFYFVDSAGAVRECPDKDANNWRHNHAPGHVISSMINLPDRIIRKPRLTAEQVEILKALWVLGFAWVWQQKDNSFICAGTPKPTMCDHGYWCGKENNVIKIDTKMFTLSEPLDIAKTLRDNGVDA
jgi:hypothetical protein